METGRKRRAAMDSGGHGPARAARSFFRVGGPLACWLAVACAPAEPVSPDDRDDVEFVRWWSAMGGAWRELFAASSNELAGQEAAPSYAPRIPTADQTAAEMRSFAPEVLPCQTCAFFLGESRSWAASTGRGIDPDVTTELVAQSTAALLGFEATGSGPVPGFEVAMPSGGSTAARHVAKVCLCCRVPDAVRTSPGSESAADNPLKAWDPSAPHPGSRGATASEVDSLVAACAALAAAVPRQEAGERTQDDCSVLERCVLDYVGSIPSDATPDPRRATVDDVARAAAWAARCRDAPGTCADVAGDRYQPFTERQSVFQGTLEAAARRACQARWRCGWDAGL